MNAPHGWAPQIELYLGCSTMVEARNSFKWGLLPHMIPPQKDAHQNKSPRKLRSTLNSLERPNKTYHKNRTLEKGIMNHLVAFVYHRNRKIVTMTKMIPAMVWSRRFESEIKLKINCYGFKIVRKYGPFTLTVLSGGANDRNIPTKYEHRAAKIDLCAGMQWLFNTKVMSQKSFPPIRRNVAISSSKDVPDKYKTCKYIKFPFLSILFTL